MLSYKLDFSSCVIMPGFGKSSYIVVHNVGFDISLMLCTFMNFMKFADLVIFNEFPYM